MKLPEGITVENFINEADPVFEEGMDLINAGKTEEGFAAFGKMPEWFSNAIPSGGSGLIAPKSSAISTLYLEPGLHSVECYVKMPNGKFHSTMGMVKEVYVSDAKSDTEPPKATNTIDIKEDGFHISGDLKKGEHIFQVNVINQKLHENFATSDVHLVRLEDIADINILEAWNSKFMKQIRDSEFLPIECSGCLYQYKCRGGSRYEAQQQNGKYTDLDPLADISRKI